MNSTKPTRKFALLNISFHLLITLSLVMISPAKSQNPEDPMGQIINLIQSLIIGGDMPQLTQIDQSVNDPNGISQPCTLDPTPEPIPPPPPPWLPKPKLPR